MNKVFLIGNLTRDPELRTTQSGVDVCSFTIAVNRRRTQDSNQPEADFFRISVWRQMAEVCQKYLSKGRKVSVVGRVSASAYVGNDGTPHASLEVQAEDVEFLTPKGETGENTSEQPQPAAQPSHTGTQPVSGAPVDNNGFVKVENDDLPF